MFIPDPDLDFLPILDPGSRVQKSPDPGSGYATLLITIQISTRVFKSNKSLAEAIQKIQTWRNCVSSGLQLMAMASSFFKPIFSCMSTHKKDPVLILRAAVLWKRCVYMMQKS